MWTAAWLILARGNAIKCSELCEQGGLIDAMRFNGETEDASRASEGKRGFRHLPLGTRLFCLYLITNYERSLRTIVGAINKIAFPPSSFGSVSPRTDLSGDADDRFTQEGFVLCDLSGFMNIFSNMTSVLLGVYLHIHIHFIPRKGKKTNPKF